MKRSETDADGPSRRAAVSLAGLAGDFATVRAGLVDQSAAVRAAAYSALTNAGAITTEDVRRAIGDQDPRVRRRICELSPSLPQAEVEQLLFDSDPAVIEAAAFACGELEREGAVEDLIAIASGHEDALCRESAVAALGVLGLAEGLSAIVSACGDVPAVRRRAVIALSNFEGDEVTAALERACSDRDWQVRQAAEDLLGINRTSSH